MLAVKVAGALGLSDDPSAELHVSAFLQSRDARHIAAARTGAATRAGSAAVGFGTGGASLRSRELNGVHECALELSSPLLASSSDPRTHGESVSAYTGEYK